ILLGPSFHTEAHMDQIRSLHNANPAVVLMLVADEVTADLLRRGMLAGVSDIIETPLDEEKIEAADEQYAHDVLSRRANLTSTLRGEEGCIITVMSSKSSSGKTVLATNLVLLLNRLTDKKVVLVDVDLKFGDVCLVLKL